MTAAETAISEKSRFAAARRRRPTTRWIVASVRHAAASIDQRTVVQLMESGSIAERPRPATSWVVSALKSEFNHTKRKPPLARGLRDSRDAEF